MTQRILLHAGMVKTGSTAIQDFIWHRRAEMREIGIHYPDEGTLPQAHHRLFRGLAVDQEAFGSDAGLDGTDPIATAAVIRETDAHTIILSSEWLWYPRPYPREVLARIRDEMFPGAEIVPLVYLRDPEKHLMSAYAQHVNGWQEGRMSLREFRRFSYDQGFYDFDSRIEDFRAVFGSVNVAAFPQDDVLMPFRRIVPGLPPGTLDRVNCRRSWGRTRLQRRANFLPGLPRRVANRLIRRADRLLARFDTPPTA